jgi:hypothetical protein
MSCGDGSTTGQSGTQHIAAMSTGSKVACEMSALSDRLPHSLDRTHNVHG